MLNRKMVCLQIILELLLESKLYASWRSWGRFGGLGNKANVFQISSAVRGIIE